MNMTHRALSAAVASLVTLLIGFIWYHPNVFETYPTNKKSRKNNVPRN